MPSLEFSNPASSLQPPVSKPRRALFKWIGLAIAAVAILAIAIAGWFGYQYYQAAYTPAQPSGQPVALTIEPGVTADQISQQLLQARLIANIEYFKMYLRLNPKSAIQAGNFSIPQNISMKDLTDRLSLAERQQAIITFPEGWRREELAEEIDKQYQQGKISFTGKEFSDLALTPNAALRQKLGNRLPPASSLQGYLFPDTYHIDSDATAQELIVKMLDNYLKKVTPDVQAGFAKQNLTEYQALILAAIIERESYSGDERPIIGDIMLTRLRTGEILGADAAIQYFLGYSNAEKTWWRHAITEVDLATPSPYNTRRNVGLPPAPIANPSLEAIKAVAMPKDTPYLYYLHDSDGNVYYAETLSEHYANVAKYL